MKRACKSNLSLNKENRTYFALYELASYRHNPIGVTTVYVPTWTCLQRLNWEHYSCGGTVTTTASKLMSSHLTIIRHGSFITLIKPLEDLLFLRLVSSWVLALRASSCTVHLCCSKCGVSCSQVASCNSSWFFFRWCFSAHYFTSSGEQVRSSLLPSFIKDMPMQPFWVLLLYLES